MYTHRQPSCCADVERLLAERCPSLGSPSLRFAIAALPSLQMARWRFVGRLIHRDDATWAAALDDAIKFNGASRDDAQVWPGGVAATATDDDGPTQEGG